MDENIIVEGSWSFFDHHRAGEAGRWIIVDTRTGRASEQQASGVRDALLLDGLAWYYGSVVAATGCRGFVLEEMPWVVAYPPSARDQAATTLLETTLRLGRERPRPTAESCSYWRRHEHWHAEDTGFGADPRPRMTPEQAERHYDARDREDDADPPCGACMACASFLPR